MDMDTDGMGANGEIEQDNAQDTAQPTLDNYEAVFTHDQGVFRTMDKQKILLDTKLRLDESGDFIEVPLLGFNFYVDLEGGEVFTPEMKVADRREKLLIMHHLIYCKPQARITGRDVPFHSIKGCSQFFNAFVNHTYPYLIKRFSSSSKEFLHAGRALHGDILALGDASVRLYLFPLIPITYILWEADDEFSASVMVTFDEGITSCTHPEDVPTLGTYGSTRLIETADMLAGDLGVNCE